MRRILSSVSVIALFALGCSSDDPTSSINAAQPSGGGSPDTSAAGGTGGAGSTDSAAGAAGAGAIEEAPLPTSGIPLLSAAQNTAKPAGTAGNLKVLDWAGF